jgi:hypothetical protein
LTHLFKAAGAMALAAFLEFPSDALAIIRHKLETFAQLRERCAGRMVQPVFLVGPDAGGGFRG